MTDLDADRQRAQEALARAEKALETIRQAPTKAIPVVDLGVHDTIWLASRLLAALDVFGAVDALEHRAANEPLDTDLSDYSDDFCRGFLAGQVNLIHALRAALRTFEEGRG